VSDALTLYPQGAGRDCKDAKASTLTLYTRAGCPLCEDMAEAARAQIGAHRLIEIDVDTDAGLKARYGWDVPLLFDGDVEICRHEFDAVAFAGWLKGQAQA
jgi:glutaredoxin